MKKKSSNKNNKKINQTKILIIIIIVLSICLVGLGGYVVYDKFLSKDENFLCEGCKGDVAPVEVIDPVGEIERRLDVFVPVLDDELDYYHVSNEGWPYKAQVSFNRESFIELAKDFKDLSISNTEYLSVSKELIGSLEITVYDDSTELDKSKAAVWKYDDVYYAFKLKNTSSLDFDKCVEDLVKQVINK